MVWAMPRDLCRRVYLYCWSCIETAPPQAFLGAPVGDRWRNSAATRDAGPMRFPIEISQRVRNFEHLRSDRYNRVAISEVTTLGL